MMMMIEGREEMNCKSEGVTVVGSDTPPDYHKTTEATTTVRSNPPPQSITSQLAAAGCSPAPAGVPEKKKRGRPRKTTTTLSPKPISSAAPPPVIDFSTGKTVKIRPPHKEIEADLGSRNWVSSSVGANFMPHIINVHTGEDVMMKVISFSQQGPRAICILSANGVISSVTLHQPDSSGGTLTYEGRFEILSLAGSFIPSESGGIRNRSGGMSVSLSSADGRVVGGSVAGLLVAASPVQIIVGSFFTGVQQEQKPTKKQKLENITISIPTTDAVLVRAQASETYSSKQDQSPPSFRGDNSSSSYYAPNKQQQQPADINVSLG